MKDELLKLVSILVCEKIVIASVCGRGNLIENYK